MGLVKHLLFWPVTGPMALIEFSMRQVDGMVRRELTDDELIKDDLMALQVRLELGEIDEEEYVASEAEVMLRLREARAWRQRYGMEEEWAPLGYGTARSDPSDADDGENDSRPPE